MSYPPTTSISFSLLSFFSMVFWAELFLLSYILVPAASSIMDRIYTDRTSFSYNRGGGGGGGGGGEGLSGGQGEWVEGGVQARVVM